MDQKIITQLNRECDELASIHWPSAPEAVNCLLKPGFIFNIRKGIILLYSSYNHNES
jgi:hypothetical protein